MVRKPQVLVIDDDPLFRSRMVSLLREDFVVSVAGEGSEGYYKALEQIPDIAIIDIQMPGWDGLRTLSEFVRHPRLNRVRTIILTSDASEETVRAAVSGGADDYLIKTHFSKDEFCKKLKSMVPARLDAPAGPSRVTENGAGEHPAAEELAVPVPDGVMTRRRTWHDAVAECTADRGADAAILQAIIDDWD